MVQSERVVSKAQLTNQLKEWIATCLIEGYSIKSIAEKLSKYVAPSISTLSEVEKIASDPIMRANLKLRSRYKKFLSLFKAQSDQFKKSSFSEQVPVLDDLSSQDFFNNFYYANRPVVVRGLMKSWPALRLWNPEYFSSKYGNQTVEVSAGRNDDPRFEERFTHHRREIKMSEFLDLIQTDIGNDIYLVAKNNLLLKGEFAELLTQIGFPEGFLNSNYSSNDPRIWIGGGGTITPLHHDSTNIFFGQVYGRKLIQLIPPFEIAHLYNERACFSSVDLEHIDFEIFPMMRDVPVLEVIVHPGDFLLFPIGWWHAVKSLDVSISLSYQNFAIAGGVTVWNHAP